MILVGSFPLRIFRDSLMHGVRDPECKHGVWNGALGAENSEGRAGRPQQKKGDFILLCAGMALVRGSSAGAVPAFEG